MAIIKAGTYKFDEFLTLLPYGCKDGTTHDVVNIKFTLNTPLVEVPVQCTAIRLIGNTTPIYFGSPYQDSNTPWYIVQRFDYYLADEFATAFGNKVVTVLVEDGWSVEGADVVTVLEDTEVSDEFGVWFDSNVKPQMSASATIIYNGVTTSLETGKTATLECNGKKMKSNIVVSV